MYLATLINRYIAEGVYNWKYVDTAPLLFKVAYIMIS